MAQEKDRKSGVMVHFDEGMLEWIDAYGSMNGLDRAPAIRNLVYLGRRFAEEGERLRRERLRGAANLGAEPEPSGPTPEEASKVASGGKSRRKKPA